MLMEYALQLKNPDGLQYIFDLKGSLVDRKTKGKIKSTTTLKDVNFLMAVKANPDFVSLGQRTRKKLLRVINADVDFLSGLGLMDYSVLLGIENLGNKLQEEIDKIEEED